MTNPMQYTATWVRDRLRELDAAISQRRAEISTTNGKLVAANARAQSIQDSRKRASAVAAIRGAVARQVRIAKAFRTFAAKVDQVTRTARAWVETQAPGLGVVPVVPVAIIAGLTVGAVVWGANAWLKTANAAQRTSVESLSRATDAVIAGQMSIEQFERVSKALDAQAENASPPVDPLGLANLASALVPVGLVVLAILVGPSVVDALNARRPARRGA